MGFTGLLGWVGEVLGRVDLGWGCLGLGAGFLGDDAVGGEG